MLNKLIPAYYSLLLLDIKKEVIFIKTCTYNIMVSNTKYKYVHYSIYKLYSFSI